MSGTNDLTNPVSLMYHVIMANIPLFGKRGLDKFAIVDEEDVEKVAGVRWHLSDTGYAVNRSNHKTVRMHRIINNTPKGMETDHKNHNRIDNRKSNLRTVTHQENVKNSRGKGYCWDKSKQRWTVIYKQTFYGRYITKGEAKQAYKLACSGVPYQKREHRVMYHLPTGVFKNRSNRGYQAKAQINGERIYLGTFATIEEAENAYLDRKRG